MIKVAIMLGEGGGAVAMVMVLQPHVALTL